MKFKSLPVTSLEDVTVDLEQLSTRTILDSTPTSFVQLPAAKKLAHDSGSVAVTFTASNTSASTVITHSIGRTPTAITLTAMTSPVFASVLAATSSTITIQAFDPFATLSTTIAVYWMADG